ncbi:hypothetical protein F4860DRAFT_486301 [Xylaria cubensis]|nr:hypothetical protein F4860DRAFT_486301 [Xylaria cubensis]
MKIGSWCLPKQTNPIIQEGVITLVPRVVVEPESVCPGKEFSGVLRIVSTFKGPDGSWKCEGTAFAVGKFHVLTAGHMMWHQKLGPAQSAVLYTDTRSGTITEGIECVAVAVHAEWIKCYQPENDFCMIAIAQGFNSGIRLLQLGVAPSYPNVGRLLGFPSDLSVTSRGNELIECQGPVRSRENNAGIILIHKVNTSGGSSGSPFFVEGKVVAVHSSFNRNKMENYAVPIGQNGNNVAQFQNVLRYMTCRGLKLSDAALYLGEVTYEDYCKQKILGFGSLPASGS